MINYHHGRFQFWNTLFRVHGSALYRAVVPSFTSTGILLFLYHFSSEPQSDERWFAHPYPIACMMVAFTFLLTFKCSFSYNRYWEACTAIHQMHSKWLDVAIELGAFHLQSVKFSQIVPPTFGAHPHIDHVFRKRRRGKSMTPKSVKEMIMEDEEVTLNDTSINMLRMFSPFRIFSDRKKKKKNNKKMINSFLSNSYNHRSFKDPTKRSINSHTAVNAETSLGAGMFTSRDKSPPTRPRLAKITTQADVTGGMGIKPGPSLFLQEASHLISLLSAVAFSTLRNDVETAESPLRQYQIGSPWPPVDPDEKGAGLFDDDDKTSRLITSFRYFFAGERTPHQRTVYNACRPFSVLGGVSDTEIEVLQRARGPLAKTALCTMWVQEFITREHLNGSLGKVHPPILSRLYQFVSDGMIGYNQARKVAYVPFPFPHTQLTTFFLLVVTAMMPILMLTYVHEIAVAAILNTVTVGCFYGLWLVAKELEDPFRNVPNDLPLNNFQAQFNEALLCMFAGYHPESWWEIGEADKPQLEGFSSSMDSESDFDEH